MPLLASNLGDKQGIDSMGLSDFDEGIFVPTEHLEEFERRMLYYEEDDELDPDDELDLDDEFINLDDMEFDEAAEVIPGSITNENAIESRGAINAGAAAVRAKVAATGAATSATAAAAVVGNGNRDPLTGKYLQRVKKMIWCLKPDNGVLFPQDYYYPFGYGQRFHRARRYYQARKKYSPYGRNGGQGHRGYIYRKMIVDERFTAMPEETVVEEIDNPDEYRRKLQGKRNKPDVPKKGGPTRGKDLVITRCYKFGDQKICCKNKKQTIFGSQIGVTRNTND